MRVPGPQQRQSIIGRTGTGKTVDGLFWLLTRAIEQDGLVRPWLILDPKHDEQLAQIGARRIGSRDPLPAAPDIYITSPDAVDQEDTDQLLWRVYKRGHMGVYADEGHTIGHSPAFQAILTQGRSKYIPVIVITQRPAWISRFVWSESEFFSIKALNNIDDKKTVCNYIPFKDRFGTYNYPNPPEFGCYYYDVGRGELDVCDPVPPPEDSIRRIRAYLREHRGQVPRRL